MANILFLTARLPFPISHGGALRVYNICSELSNYHHCYLACTENDNTDSLNVLKQRNVFKSIQLLPTPPKCKSFNRHFRLSEANINRLGRPEYYKHVCNLLREVVVHNNIDVVVAVTLNMAEYIDILPGVKKVIDDYDCATLTLDRQATVLKKNQSFPQKMANIIKLARVRNQESKLTLKYDLITTISPADLTALCNLNKINTDLIHLIPNGVSDPEPDSSSIEELNNSIAFWGDLSFPPNKQAVRYFYTEIYRPFLEAKGVRWYIIGRNADQEIQVMAKMSNNIKVTGFVENLNELVRRIPVMVNPMVMGSGLKNKVLEALILRRAVISTSMGVEALNIHDGVHYVCADTPEKFGRDIIELLQDSKRRNLLGQQGYTQVKKQYSWSSAGIELSRLISELVKSPDK